MEPRKQKKRENRTMIRFTDMDAYRRLQKNIKLAGLPPTYFSEEISKVVVAIDAVVQQLVELQMQGKVLREETVREMIKEALGEPSKETESKDSEE